MLGHRYRRGRGGSDDIEMLQTDIMRFFAIMMLCLLAVFALAGSLPPTSPKPAFNPSPKDRLSLLPKAGGKKSSMPVASVEAAPQKKRYDRTTVSPASVSSPHNLGQTPSPKTREGFSLRFESARAFNSLLQRGVIQFYAFAGESSWQAYSRGAGILFRKVRVHNPFFSMSTATVPRSLIVSFRGVSSLEPSEVEFGVVLPGEIRTAIDRCLESPKQGPIDILETGQVRCP